MLVPWLLNPFIGRLSLALQALFIVAGIVILLTWVGMPVLVRILRPWLQRCPEGNEEGGAPDLE
jgi:antibiotic biosynthesis monooxygenase (ABM) superfamily enzyme